MRVCVFSKRTQFEIIKCERAFELFGFYIIYTFVHAMVNYLLRSEPEMWGFVLALFFMLTDVER